MYYSTVHVITQSIQSTTTITLYIRGSTRYLDDRYREVGYKYTIFEVHCRFCDVHVSIDL